MAFGAACARRAPDKATASGGDGPAAELDRALAPAAAVQALRRAGGGQVHATTAMRVQPPGASAGPAEDAARDAVTTTTDLWMDHAGQFRLTESNDRDGGREVVLTGKTLTVGLRHGKLTRRPAQEPEVTRTLEEALGGPWAAWQIARRQARVDRTEEGSPGARIAVYKLSRAGTPVAPEATPDDPPLRRWRGSVSVSDLNGEVRLDLATQAVVAARIEARFSFTRDGAPFQGSVNAEAALTEAGKVPTITPPPADELLPRQRTILEERALLGRAASDPPGPATPERTP